MSISEIVAAIEDIQARLASLESIVKRLLASTNPEE